LPIETQPAPTDDDHQAGEYNVLSDEEEEEEGDFEDDDDEETPMIETVVQQQQQKQQHQTLPPQQQQQHCPPPTSSQRRSNKTPQSLNDIVGFPSVDTAYTDFVQPVLLETAPPATDLKSLIQLTASYCTQFLLYQTELTSVQLESAEMILGCWYRQLLAGDTSKLYALQIYGLTSPSSETISQIYKLMHVEFLPQFQCWENLYATHLEPFRFYAQELLARKLKFEMQFPGGGILTCPGCTHNARADNKCHDGVNHNCLFICRPAAPVQRYGQEAWFTVCAAYPNLSDQVSEADAKATLICNWRRLVTYPPNHPPTPKRKQ